MWQLLAIIAGLFIVRSRSGGGSTSGGGYKQKVDAGGTIKVQLPAAPPGEVIPGTTYRLNGGTLKGEVYISPAGCVYVAATQGPFLETLSVPVIRADGVESTYTLPGKWRNTLGAVPQCYAKAGPPQSHLERLLGNLAKAPGIVVATASGEVANLKAIIAKEMPQVAPLLDLADKVALAAGSPVTFGQAAGALLNGAKASGIPVDTIGQLLAQPEQAINKAVTIAKQQVGA